ncbi:subtilisin-like protein, partial [Ramicandelaber brevisporus]
LSGYSGRFSRDMVDEIRRMPSVAFVEEDTLVHADEVQFGAPWGLARTSSTRPSLALDLQGSGNAFVFNDAAGEGVTVYTIDSGVRASHREFAGGRAKNGPNLTSDNLPLVDTMGHGTHVAGTIAGATYGVAKKAALVAVKVFTARGSAHASGILQALDYVMKEHQAGRSGPKGTVVNMSLSGGKNAAEKAVFRNAAAAGIHIVVAAGNKGDDACNYSPGDSPDVITVGATTIQNQRAGFSNYGSCVTLYAPGAGILSSVPDSDTATAWMQGTSMACPHVSGTVAYLLSMSTAPISPAAMRSLLRKMATKGVVGNLSTQCPNLLLSNGA